MYIYIYMSIFSGILVLKKYDILAIAIIHYTCGTRVNCGVVYYCASMVSAAWSAYKSLHTE